MSFSFRYELLFLPLIKSVFELAEVKRLLALKSESVKFLPLLGDYLYCFFLSFLFIFIPIPTSNPMTNTAAQIIIIINQNWFPSDSISTGVSFFVAVGAI